MFSLIALSSSSAITQEIDDTLSRHTYKYVSSGDTITVTSTLKNLFIAFHQFEDTDIYIEETMDSGTKNSYWITTANKTTAFRFSNSVGNVTFKPKKNTTVSFSAIASLDRCPSKIFFSNIPKDALRFNSFLEDSSYYLSNNNNTCIFFGGGSDDRMNFSALAGFTTEKASISIIESTMEDTNLINYSYYIGLISRTAYFKVSFTDSYIGSSGVIVAADETSNSPSVTFRGFLPSHGFAQSYTAPSPSPSPTTQAQTGSDSGKTGSTGKTGVVIIVSVVLAVVAIAAGLTYWFTHRKSNSYRQIDSTEL